MITITAILNAIEVHAENAAVHELRVIKKEVERLRPSLCLDDQEHADGLLLKLDRLISEQIVVADDITRERCFPAGDAGSQNRQPSYSGRTSARLPY